MNSIKHTTKACFQTLSNRPEAESNIDVEGKKVKTMILHSLMLMVMAAVFLSGCDSNSSSTATGGTGDTTAVVLDGRFVDAAVVGLTYSSASQSGATNDEGGFQYQSGEAVTFSAGDIILGNATGKSLVTPFDLSAHDEVVMHIASLLQSMDDDASDHVIRLSGTKLAAVTTLLGGGLDLSALEDDPDTVTDEVADALADLDAAVLAAAGDDYVTPSEALVAMLSDLAQEEFMARNISRTPDETSDKAGVDIMEELVPARMASGEELTEMGEVHPILTSYWDAKDAFVAASYDNGSTWKRTNLSRHAGRTFTIGNTEFTAAAKGPSMSVEGNYVLVTWISTYCQGAPDFVVDGVIPAEVENPAKAVLANESDAELQYVDGVDTEVVDLFKVLGTQGTVDYSATYPLVGVVPYHCVWSARGILDVDGTVGADIGMDDTLGQFIWFKAQQMTSGVRDAKLDWSSGAAEFGFGAVWQEDPEGLMPGEGEGPGVGWSGAKTHHKTNIWYSYLRWDQFAEADLSDTEALGEGRPKSLYTMSVPVPVSDNDSCNIGANTQKTICLTDAYCSDTATVPIQGGDSDGTFCVVDYDATAGYTEDVDAVLDGDTAASRPNLHFAPVVDVDGVTVIGARALVMYEESKGLCELGKGCTDSTFYPYDVGKFVMYHHMPDFADPLFMQQGDVISAPVQTATQDPFDDSLEYIPPEDDPATAFDESALYENARRERFVVNEDPLHPVKFVMIYKQGWYNQGERADIFMRRAVDGYDISNVEQDICVSCVTPDEESMIVEDSGDGLSVKVQSWSWTPMNLDDESWANPYDDARSLRALLQGDRLLIGFAWTPNWKFATTADPSGSFKDHYDFFVRRSFDAGATFTNLEGLDEGPRNTSYLENNKENVVEPRLATLGGSILDCEESTFIPGTYGGGGCSQLGLGLDNPQLAQFFVVTYCTAANVEREPLGGVPVHAPGLDCYYSWTQDNGETYVAPPKEVEVVDEYGQTVTIEVPDFECLMCSDAEEVEPEVVLTEGSSFADTDLAAEHEDVIAEMHAGWVANGIEDASSQSTLQNGSDAWYGLFELKPDTTTEE